MLTVPSGTRLVRAGQLPGPQSIGESPNEEQGMTGREFINVVGNNESDILQGLLEILAETRSAYCVIGGLAVNAYAEPVVSLDMDVIVAADEVDEVAAAAKNRGMKVVKSEHRLHLSSPNSDLRIQLQTDVRYQEFLSRAVEKEVLGYRLRVAAVTDVLQGKLWAYLDKSRRRSKRLRDLADIVRLVEAHPTLENQLPPSIRGELKE